jgi:predicted ATPase
VAEGNPLVLEQLLALAAEEEREELVIPHSINALLAARLDRLKPEERALLDRASVVGREFWRGALVTLSPPETEVSALLQRLVRRRLIVPERSSFPGEDAFRFGHILIRDAAYAGIPKETRAELHERFADWLEGRGSPYEEIVAYHLEQAYRYQAELGPVDERGQTLARRAGEMLARAGTRAHARHDHAAAANLLARSADLLPPDDHLRLSLVPELAENLVWVGRYADARSVLADAIERTRRAGDQGLEWHARLLQLQLSAQVGTEVTSEELKRKAEEALAVFEEISDARGLAKAQFLIGLAHSYQSRNEAAARALERAIAQARLVGDDSLEGICVGTLSRTLLSGPTPVAEAIDYIEEILRSGSTRFIERALLGQLSCLYAEQGRSHEARHFLGQARKLAEEFGTEVDRALIAIDGGTVETFTGNLGAAEAELRRGYEILERLGERGWRSTVAVNLAAALVAQGRLDEANDFLRISEETAASDDLASQVPLRSIRARILAERGELGEAEGLAREALSLLEGTDNLDARAGALLNLARVLCVTERTEEARSVAIEALRLCEQKGNVAMGREVGDLLRGLTSGPHR